MKITRTIMLAFVAAIFAAGCAELDETGCLALAAGLERVSEHPLARAVATAPARAASASAGVGTAPQSVTSHPSTRAAAITSAAIRGEEGRRSCPTNSARPVSQTARKAAVYRATASGVISVTRPRRPLVPNFSVTGSCSVPRRSGSA